MSSEWIACNDRLPPHNARVAVLASNPSYQSGFLQPLAGWFEEKYYDTTVNRFKLIGARHGEWRVAYWMLLPENDGLRNPFDPSFKTLFDWQNNAL